VAEIEEFSLHPGALVFPHVKLLFTEYVQHKAKVFSMFSGVLGVY
jgi:hypothetical protein